MSWTAPKIQAMLLKIPASKPAKMPSASMRSPSVSARTVSSLLRGGSGYGGK